jgi:ribonuclease R
MTREDLDSRKQMIMEFLASKTYRPMTLKEMGSVLQVPAKQKKDFRKVIEELIEEGKIHYDSRGKIKLVPDNIKTGKYMGTQRGFGFVRVEGEDEDIYIAAQNTKGAVDGDTVKVAVDGNKTGKKREGTITAIIERGTGIIVGTYSKSKSFGFVIADNQKFGKDIYIAKSDSKGAVTEHKVVVEITDYGTGDRNPEGRIIEIIGHINDPGVDIISIIKAYGLPEEYPDKVMAQIEDIKDTVSEEEKQGRTDYRDLQTVTIDGEDAKDLDDAITLSKEGDIYKLGVHIADVSNYVTENSPLDKEALKRGTSVYLVDRVIPMLPHKLSNGICSLNQGEDRLALSCIMDIKPSGEIISHKIEETIINVDRRMSYTSVNKIVELGDEEEREKYKEFIPMFELMYELADILRKRRFKRGSVDFDFPESKIILDERGKPVEIKEYERNNAHRIIEEFMLAANQTVAEEYFWQELPFVYRIHEVPDSEKIMQLGIFVNNFGYILKTDANGEVHPKEIQKLINNVKDKPEEALISRLALRSMRQAKYSVSCEGHFGLAMKYYCHFTSPIRRYPDLQIHRIIKENIRGKLVSGRISHYNKILPEVADRSSQLERRADDSEREVEKLKKAEYMEQFIGQSFDGIISGLSSWGMYVELPNTVEGMVRVADIPGDYYYFDEEHYSMVGERTGKMYKFGSKIRVTVASVDKLLKTIDFVIAEEEEITGNKDKQPSGVQCKQKSKRKQKKIKDKETATKELKTTEDKKLKKKSHETKAPETVVKTAVKPKPSPTIKKISRKQKVAKVKGIKAILKKKQLKEQEASIPKKTVARNKGNKPKEPASIKLHNNSVFVTKSRTGRLSVKKNNKNSNKSLRLQNKQLAGRKSLLKRRLKIISNKKRMVRKIKAKR